MDKKAAFYNYLKQEISGMKDAGLYKDEWVIESSQNSKIKVDGGRDVLNLCSNNYLGLADHPEVVKAAKDSMDFRGYGMASVRFICGTQDLHKKLEHKISEFYGTEDTILYPSCFDANTGLFEVLLTKEDAVISDSLNHASIIDGIRLCKANRYRYNNSNMQDLEAKLKEANVAGARHKMIATDGVFSMDGYVANLKGVCNLADKYGATVMVDECHAAGFLGETGRGTPEHCGVMDRIDVITGTLGKALGGGTGGYTTGKKEIISMLRQRSRPYLFSNSISPCVAAASFKVFEMLSNSTKIRDRLMKNTAFYREGLKKIGMTIKEGIHPIVPVMIGGAALSQEVARKMYKKGVYVVGFFYPVVPRKQARVRTQVSAAHTKEDLQFVIDKFAEVKVELGL